MPSSSSVAIVIATLNAGKSLHRCLESCVSQTQNADEIIIIDGGSTDDTVRIIRRFQPYIAFWVSEPDSGIYNAWNKALLRTTATWVLFRGADDIFWQNNSLESAIRGLQQAAPDELLCYGQVAHTDEDGRVVGITGTDWEGTKRLLNKRMSLPHAGTFHRNELFRRFGGFDETYKVAGDYDLMLRAVSRGRAKGRFLPGLIVTRMSGTGISHRAWGRTKLESIKALLTNRASYVPTAQIWELVIITFLRARRAALEQVLGGSRANTLRARRRLRISQRLEKTLPFTGSPPKQ